jgi:hypothetical protein
VLEVLGDIVALSEAERWWIAYGRCCGWPLTNIMSGGYPSAEVILARQRRKAARKIMRKAAWDAAALRRQQRKVALSAAWEAASKERLRAVGWIPQQRDPNPPHGIPAEIARRCLQFFNEHATASNLIDAVIASVRVTRATAAQLYAEWRSAQEAEAVQRAAKATRRAATVARRTASTRCFQLFEKYLGERLGEDGLLGAVAIEANVPIKTVKRLYRQWARTSMRRGNRALKKAHDAMIAQWKEGPKP